MLDLTIDDIQKKIDRGELTYEALTLYYLKRIEAYNEQVNAVSEINPNAIRYARELDLEYRLKGRRSSLHGIPVMIKDNINIVGDDFHTTAGAYVFKDLQPAYDATIVTKLKEAGAVILGKTNMSEFANFISENSPNGFSALKGQVKNPYGKYDVGGSSSGSGVAVACGFCQLAVGTETSGSIISPASCNSVIGLKPSVGVVSRHGIIPISTTQDIPGPMGRHIEDVALLESVIEGFDLQDLSTKSLLKLKDRTLSFGVEVSVEKLRLGVYKRQAYKNDRIDANRRFDEVIEQLTALNAQMVYVAFDKKAFVIDWDVLYYEFPREMENYLASVKEQVGVSTLADIVAFHRTDKKTYVPYDQKQFDNSLEKADKFESDYERALRDSFNYGSLIDQWIEDDGLDVICYADCDAIDIAARNGHPSITIPIGYGDNGEPVGFTMTAPMFSEEKLLRIAAKFIELIGEHENIFEEGTHLETS